MKCDHCDRDATVHEVTMRNGVRIEKHLCDGCAAQRGVTVQPNAPINELLKQFMTQGITPGIHVTPQGRQGACPSCRLTFAEFKQQGLLGCPECYRAFESQLMPLLERAQEGGQEHTGKRPRRVSAGGAEAQPPLAQPALAPPATPAALPSADRERVLATMRRALEAAVAQEKYELAAKIRDQIKGVESGATPVAPAPRAGHGGQA
ncbi:MAG: UvrB/UvrC motif-containing protein [Phycisphaerales bacterium]